MQEIYDAIGQYVADANDQFVEKLGLNPCYYQGDAPPGEKFGFSMPRKITPPRRLSRMGFNQFNVTVDVLVEYILEKEANAQAETSKLLSEVTGVILRLNSLVSAPSIANSGEWVPGELSSVQSQLTKEPHHLKVAIVGEASFNSYIYLDRLGQIAIKC